MGIFKKTALGIFIASSLVACGGGGSDDQTKVATGTETGVLTDSAVSGVNYTTTSGVTGTTDAQGHFKFNKGDKVTFKIGGVTLGGTVNAQATLTPIDLAGTGTSASTIANNLLVLLQSLDSDGNHANGITILPATVTAATSATLDFTQATATFSANSAFTGLIASASSTGAKLVTPTNAQANFKKVFFESIQGVWEMGRTASGSDALVVRFGANGDYIMGQVGAPESDGSAGIEVGKIDWDPLTGGMTSTRTLDTDRSWGFSNPKSAPIPFKLKLDGEKLVLEETGTPASYTLTRVPNNNTSLVGTWVIGTDTFNTQTLTFFDNGYYLLSDPIGDTVHNCGGAGIELGKYHVSGTTVNVIKTEILYDTNGCAGFGDSSASNSFNFTVSSDGKTAKAFDENDVLTRVSF